MNRPLPRATSESRPFWEGCAVGVLRYQRCARCGQAQRIPRALCESCRHPQLEWLDSARMGRILSFTVVHRAPSEAFRAETPYVIAIVDMDEGFRLMVNIEGGAAAQPAIGRAVRIGFRNIAGVALPQGELVS